MKNPLADRKISGLDAAKLSALLWIGAEALTDPGTELTPDTLKRRFREFATNEPIDSMLVTVIASSYLFYLAEKDTNPKCQNFWDALTFITTSLSVGYDNLFAETDAGKAIASFVMTVGPALTNRLLDTPASEAVKPADADSQAAIIDRLEAILNELKAQRATR